MARPAKACLLWALSSATALPELRQEARAGDGSEISHSARIRVKPEADQIEREDQEPHPQFLAVGDRRIAFLRRNGRGAGARLPGMIWLGGFMSAMRSTKASFLDQFAASQGRAFLRFDYSGHGQSDGRFEDGTISRWLPKRSPSSAL